MKLHGSLHYIYAWVGLLALTGISWALSYAHLGPIETGVALGIACVKATLVALIFMEAIEARFSAMLLPIGGLVLVAILVGLAALDVGTRRTFPRAPLVPAESPALRPRSGG